MIYRFFFFFCFQEIEGDRINEERAERTFMVPDCHSDMVSYHTDSGHGWSEGDTGHIDEMPGESFFIFILFCFFFFFEISECEIKN